MNFALSFKRLAGALFATALLGATAQAATTCKEREGKAACEAAGCTWVKGYKTKSGTTVEAYCRNKAGRSAKKAKQSTKEAKGSDGGKKTAKAKGQKDGGKKGQAGSGSKAASGQGKKAGGKKKQSKKGSKDKGKK